MPSTVDHRLRSFANLTHSRSHLNIILFVQSKRVWGLVALSDVCACVRVPYTYQLIWPHKAGVYCNYLALVVEQHPSDITTIWWAHSRDVWQLCVDDVVYVYRGVFLLTKKSNKIINSRWWLTLVVECSRPGCNIVWAQCVEIRTKSESDMPSEMPTIARSEETTKRVQYEGYTVAGLANIYLSYLVIFISRRDISSRLISSIQRRWKRWRHCFLERFFSGLNTVIYI